MTATETTENGTNKTIEPQPEAAHTHEHDHDHDHEHSHAPTLNPELMQEVEVEAPAEEVSKAFTSVVKRFRALARIPGFRAGKVPESLIRTKFAQDIRQEVLEGLVTERFRQAMEERKLNPISQPQLTDLQLFDGQPLKFKAAFEVAPEINVSGYESVKVAKPDVALTDKEFEAELDHVLERHATVEPVEEDRALADGDSAEIQFSGEVKDLAQTVTEEGLESTSKRPPITGDSVLVEIGGKNTLPAFNDALRGAKPGQELKFEVEYPADFGERSLAGQTVSYDVTVKGIKRKTYPERDDEFAKTLGNYESWADFESKMREYASNRKKDALENQAKNKMVEELVDKFQFPVPETFVQQQVDSLLERGLRALAYQGMTTEAMRQLDFAKLREGQRDQAVRGVKASMILDRIAAAENVTASEEEVNHELSMLALRSGESIIDLRERMAKDGSLDQVRGQIRREKTTSVLYDKLAS